MGRKIPGKKHRGIKDPEKQKRQRFNKIKNKINAPPSNPDFQEIPHRVRQIAKHKEDLKSNTKIKKVRSKGHVRFKQNQGESKKQFLYRVHKACDAVIQENAFENKYKVDIKRNPHTGEVESLVKKPKDQMEQFMKEMKRKKFDKKKRKSGTPEIVLTKSQKKTKKLREKKQKKLLLKDVPQLRTDNVKFGEVVHEPPTLNAPRHVKKSTTAARPGQRSLLLTSLVQQNKSDELRKVSNKTIDKTGKRKDLPNALRRKLEQQQSDIIKAYRLLKKQKFAKEV